MSILIKGMEMPKDCNKCPMTVDGYCRIIGYPNGDAIIKRYKPLWCPLVEVPKHGRLIDAEKMKKYIRENTFQSRCLFVGKPFWNSVWEEIVGDVCYDIDAMPTIIEAEE